MSALVLHIRYGFRQRDNTQFHLVDPTTEKLSKTINYVSVCGAHVVKRDVLMVIEETDMVVTEHISDIDPNEFCTKCLGPMRALPNDSGY